MFSWPSAPDIEQHRRPLQYAKEALNGGLGGEEGATGF